MLPDDPDSPADEARAPQNPAATRAANEGLQREHRPDLPASPDLPDGVDASSIPMAQEGVGRMDPRPDEQGQHER